MKERDAAIDAVKGFCMLCVVFGHSPNKGSLADALRDFVHILYSFHVPIFLIISGWFFYQREGTWKELKNIIRRLVIPYLLTAGLFLILYKFAEVMGMPTTGMAGSILGILTGRDCGGALWFLYYLIVYQVVILGSKALSRFMMGRLNGQMVNLLPLLTGGFFVCIVFKWLRLPLLAYYFTFFFLGYYLRYVIIWLEGNVLFFFVGLITFCFLDVSREHVPNIIWVVSLLMGLLGLFRIKRIQGVIRPLSVIGECSLVVLLLHPIFIVPAKLAEHMILRVEPSGIAFKVASTLIAVAACVLADKFLWRPISARLFQVKVSDILQKGR